MSKVNCFAFVTSLMLIPVMLAFVLGRRVESEFSEYHSATKQAELNTFLSDNEFIESWVGVMRNLKSLSTLNNPLDYCF